MARRSPRLLLLIVAYNAERTLPTVLDRIPRQVLHDFDCEVLVIDDASTDGTFARGLAYRQSRPDLPLRVLKNPSNQGYGGNQKVGYRYAVEEGFDFVALIHGDGQYAPEELGRLLQPLVAGQADAVFGSRMLVRGAARRGGMPTYKLMGNKILTTTQNLLAGTRLSEWHSGYRLYRVSTLESLRYFANSDGFCFDTDIILQLLSASARVVELPIPTFYGDEICRVDGLRYARDVWFATLRYALHRSGLRPRYDLTPRLSGAARQIRSDACLRWPTDDNGRILLSGVLEHESDPESFLEELCYSLGPRSREIVVTTRSTRRRRPFTVRGLRALMSRSGFTVTGVQGSPVNAMIGSGGLARPLLHFHRLLILLAPSLFSSQVLMTAQSRPHVAHILAETRASGEAGAA